jgi:hypothetical protein
MFSAYSKHKPKILSSAHILLDPGRLKGPGKLYGRNGRDLQGLLTTVANDELPLARPLVKADRGLALWAEADDTRFRVNH